MSQIIDIRPIPGERMDRLVLATFRGSEAQWTNVNELRKRNNGAGVCCSFCPTWAQVVENIEMSMSMS